MTVSFTVIGVAQSQGSAKAFVIPAKTPDEKPRAIVTHDNLALKQWRQLVAGAAQRAANGTFFTGPVVLDVTFYLMRPKAIGAKNVHCITRPDIDKAARAISDSLTGIVFRDDALIVELRARKRYAPGGQPPCVQVTVTAADVAQLAPTPAPLFEEIGV